MAEKQAKTDLDAMEKAHDEQVARQELNDSLLGSAKKSDRELLADQQPRTRQETFEALEQAANAGTLGSEWAEATAGLDEAQAKADRLTMEMLDAAHAEREARQQQVREAHREGRRLKPLQVARIPAPEDRTLPLGRDGKSLLTPGYVGRWVRKTDSTGKDSDARISELLNVGFRFVRDPETGAIREDAGVVLMESSPEDHARWRMQHLLPVSAPAAEKRLSQAVEQINAAGRTGGSGRRVLTAFVPEPGPSQVGGE